MTEKSTDRQSEKSQKASPSASTTGLDHRTNLNTIVPDSSDGTDHASLAGTKTLVIDSELVPNERGVLNLTADKRFLILGSHARGGLGEVFRAFDRELAREVAVKEIQEQHADSDSSRARFLLEAEVTGSLEHPGVVPVYGLGSHEDGRPFYAMRFIRGESLKQALERFHATRPANYLSLEFRGLIGRFIAACNAVAYAHSRGIIHRDLKPANIMLGPFGETLVVDWGLAKRTHSTDAKSDDSATATPVLVSELTIAGAVVGTPAYMSPEQASGNPESVGPAADVYGLGATLFAVLTGKAPFAGTDANAILKRVDSREQPRVRDLVANAPPALEAICAKAMAKRVEGRYASALDLARDLERWLADEPATAWREPISVRWRRWRRRHRAAVAALTAAVLVGMVGLTAAVFAISAKNRKLDAALQLAEDRSKQARQLVDDWFTKVSDSKELRQAIGTQALRRSLLEKAKDFYQSALEEHPADPAIALESATTIERLASIADQLTPGPEVVELQGRAIQLLEELPKSANDGKRRLRLSHALSSQSNYQRKAGFAKPALESAERADEISRGLCDAEPTNGVFAISRAQNLAQLALARNANGQLDGERAARQELSNLAARMRGLGDKSANWEAIEADSTVKLTQMMDSSVEPAKKLAAEKRIVEIYEQMVQRDPKNLEALDSLASAYGNLANHQSLIDMSNEALANYAKAILAYERLTDPQSPFRLRNLANSHYNLARVQVETDKPKALGSYLKALEIQERLIRSTPNVPEFRSNMAKTCNSLAVVYDMLERLPEAIAMAERAVAVNTELFQKTPNDPQQGFDLGEAINTLGYFQKKANRLVEAEKSLARASKLWDGLIQKHPGIAAFVVEKGRTSSNLGQLMFDNRRYDVAVTECRSAIAVFDKSFGQSKLSPKAREILGKLHRLLAEVLEETAKSADAAKEWDIAIKLCPASDLAWLHLYRARYVALAHNPLDAQRILAEWEPRCHDEPSHGTAAIVAAAIYSKLTAENKPPDAARTAIIENAIAVTKRHLDWLEVHNGFNSKTERQDIRNGAGFAELFKRLEFRKFAKLVEEPVEPVRKP